MALPKPEVLVKTINANGSSKRDSEDDSDEDDRYKESDDDEDEIGSLMAELNQINK
ncbi:hypothetical protein Bca52824_078542 [Brassica carinata]|uniref:Uncharacterized protein n=1 Tax=Brassica carinata TaxID=52824 RepID=A0A8X7PZB5_BRACI|nr:hypothetical protein Bca52824_078542 [Brassica carinata]